MGSGTLILEISKPPAYPHSPFGEVERGLDDGPRHLPVTLQAVVDQSRPRGRDDAAGSGSVSPITIYFFNWFELAFAGYFAGQLSCIVTVNVLS